MLFAYLKSTQVTDNQIVNNRTEVFNECMTLRNNNIAAGRET